MAKGSKLSDIEKGQILAYTEAGKSKREIGRLLRRSERVIRNFFNNPATYGQKKTRGITKKISDRDQRRIYREASNSTKTCNQIKSDLGLNVSRETIRRTILKSPNLVSRKMKKAQALTAVHKQNRLAFARQNIRRDWSKASLRLV